MRFSAERARWAAALERSQWRQPQALLLAAVALLSLLHLKRPHALQLRHPALQLSRLPAAVIMPLEPLPLSLTWAQRLLAWLATLLAGGLAAWAQRGRRPGFQRAAAAAPWLVLNAAQPFRFHPQDELLTVISLFISTAAMTNLKAKKRWVCWLALPCELPPPLQLDSTQPRCSRCFPSPPEAGGLGDGPRRPGAPPHPGPVPGCLCPAHHACRRWA